MKTTKLLSIALVALTLLVSACSGSDSSPKSNVTFGVGSVSVLAATGQTDGNTTFTQGDSLGIYLTGYDENNLASNLLSNIPCGYGTGGWTLRQTSTFTEAEKGGKLNVLAYFPYRRSMSGTTYFHQVSTDQNSESELKVSDFLYTYQSTTIGTNPTLQLKHLLSRVVIKVTYASSSIAHCSKIRLSGRNSCNINLQSGGVTLGYSQATLDGYLSGSGNTQQATFVLPPQQLSADLPIEFVFSNKKFRLYVDQTLESGYQYTISFTSYGEESFVYNGIKVADWNQVEVKQGTLSVASDLSDFGDYETGDVIVYQHCRDKNPVTLVITGDGYTADDMARGGTFEQHVYQAYDALFTLEPYKTYREYFNAYAIAAVSNESGATNTSTGSKRDTYFGSKWGNDYSDMSVSNYNQLLTFAKTYCPDLKNGLSTIENTPVFVLVNENRYGGITSLWSDGTSYAIIPTLKDRMTWSSPDPENPTVTGDWTHIFIHECGGHAFGRLADEYAYESYGAYPYTTISGHNYKVPFALNLTCDYNNAKGTVYWKHMLNTSRYPRVGFYEGGYAYASNIWRSEVASGMIDNRFYFNAICRQLVVERIMSIAGETFNLNSFYEKDVNIDPLRDTNKSSVQRPADEVGEPIKVPPLPLPRLMN